MKLLIDECLSTELTKRAQKRGHDQASHVTWIGKRGWKDWQLKKVILDGDWTFVTKNTVDFRGPKGVPGSRGQYADVAIHAGLICLKKAGADCVPKPRSSALAARRLSSRTSGNTATPRAAQEDAWER